MSAPHARVATPRNMQDAIGRRQQAVADLQNSHDSLASKKKAYAAARANAAGAAIAERNVTKVGCMSAREEWVDDGGPHTLAVWEQAEEGLKKAGETLSAVTETIKNEVRAREAKRRLVVTTMLLELVRAEARNAREVRCSAVLILVVSDIANARRCCCSYTSEECEMG